MKAYIFLLFLITFSLHKSSCAATITSLDGFKKAVNNQHDPVCACIVADWCSICKQIKPHIQALINNPEINSRIDFIHVPFDSIPELTTEFNVTKVPTFCFFDKNGTLVEKIEGIKNIESTEEFLTKKITDFLSKIAPQSNYYLARYIPKIEETKNWLLMHCKSCLTQARNSIDFLIEKCFN